MMRCFLTGLVVIALAPSCISCEPLIQAESRKPADLIDVGIEDDVKVKDKGYKLFALGASPDAVSLGGRDTILFSILVAGRRTGPDTLKLLETDKAGALIREVGHLNDKAEDGDLTAGDRIYSGAFPLTGEKEGKKYFKIWFSSEGRIYSSQIYEFAITAFPKGPAPSEPSMLVEDSKSGQKLYANQLILAFRDKTGSDRIVEIITKEEGRVVGTIPSLGVYQVAFSGDKKAEVVHEVIARLRKYSEVDFAEPNFAAAHK